MRFVKVLIGLVVATGLMAGGLAACATRSIPYDTLEARYGLPASRTFETAAGPAVHYTDEGPREARTLIMVHGFAASVHAWRPWIERLSTDHRIVALDLPGHGLTEAPRGYRASLDANSALVGELADHLGVDRFVLIGNSMGGAVSWNYALQHPERLEGLVLVDAAGWPGEDAAQEGGPPLVFQLLNNPVGRAVLKAFDPALFARGGLEDAYLDETLVTDELLRRYRDLALAPGHRDILLTQRPASGRPVTASDFADLKVPTLVMSGEQDRLVPVEDARAFAAAIPGAKLVTYPDGGHLPMEQLPDRSAADLRAFLETLPAR